MVKANTAKPRARETYVAPRNNLEKLLADIWAGVLDLPRVSITDDFFVLGGHSLSAFRVVGRICRNLDLEVPLAQLFEEPTIAQLASYLAPNLNKENNLPPADLPIRGSRPKKLPLSFGQQRLWLLDSLESSGYNMPACLQLQGSLSTLAME